MPSENLLILSFMALPKSVCSVAVMVALTMGMNGLTLLCVVEIASSRG